MDKMLNMIVRINMLTFQWNIILYGIHQYSRPHFVNKLKNVAQTEVIYTYSTVNQPLFVKLFLQQTDVAAL